MLIPVVHHEENEAFLNTYMDLLSNDISKYNFLCPNGCASYHAIKVHLHIERNDDNKKVSVVIIEDACCPQSPSIIRQRLQQNLKF